MEDAVFYGFLSLIPAILAVGLAFLTKNVLISLLAALYAGCLIITGGNPWTAMQDMFSGYLFVDMASGSNPQTIILMSFVGGFVALIEATGGAKAFANAIASKVNSRTVAQNAAWVGGLAIFFSDSGNSLILGPIFKPIMDRLRVSRAKLSYILDSTSSPVCILIPVTGWGVYIMNIIATEFEGLGIEASDAATFVQAIPYQFYAILVLLLVPLSATLKRDFGPMYKAEQYCLKNGPKAEQLKQDADVKVSDNVTNATPWHMILPLIVMFVTIFVMFFGWGFPTKNVAGSKIRIALTSGYFLATVVLILMSKKSKIFKFSEMIDIWVGGVKNMAGILAIIVSAWGVGSVCKALGTSDYIVGLTSDILSPALVPALLFLVGAVISFATGTSWGTMAILLPIGINMAVAFDVSVAITIGAVLSGSLFGDHCAPISDTTVMSSMAGGVYHMEHVTTQIPYAIVAAAAAFVAYLIVGGLQLGAGIALIIAIIILVALYLLCCKLWGGRVDKAE